MAFELTNFDDPTLDPDYLDWLVDHQAPANATRYGLLWDYFHNPMRPMPGTSMVRGSASARPYCQAQEAGLPPRITGVHRGSNEQTDLNRKEVVIENDIAWRVQTMVDFLFGRPVTIRSLAGEPALAERIEEVLAAMLDANGGVRFLQELALFGGIFGFVDIALRTPAGGKAPIFPPPSGPAREPSAGDVSAAGRRPVTSTHGARNAGDHPRPADGRGSSSARSELDKQRALDAARAIQLETVEATRILPILAEDDCRTPRYWVQRFIQHPPRIEASQRPWLTLPWRSRSTAPAAVEVIEILAPDWWQRYENRRLVSEGPNPLGVLPVVHVQNVSLSGSYAGLSDVEPLVPLQDELNTRLSDRANRVTYQSFKMYLGKGIDDFLERPVGPGQMWATQNLSASIEEFGNDPGSPSEDAHIAQIRHALDKVSGVPPLAAGLLGGNLGHLTSATALKVVLGGLLARTARKRLSYGAALGRLTELALAWLDRTGALPTHPDDRRIEVHWPDPLPHDESEQLRNAKVKAGLGVPAERILAELGYDRRSLRTER